MEEFVIGYKVFNPDFTCRKHQFEVGKRYNIGGNPIICERGFHFCRNASKCFDYYSFDPNNKVAKIKAYGCLDGDPNDKECCVDIEILEEISWLNVLNIVNTGVSNTGLCNSGNRNSGDRNSGNRNSGDRNSGDRNSGDRNSGNRNSGDWNSGNRNSGDRNSGDWNSGDRNSGNRNSGDRNSGDCNSGDCNSGYRNSGDRNSGDRNSGDWNSGDCNSGYFNSNNPNIIRVFNRDCDIKTWGFCDKPNFIYNVHLTEWIPESSMTDEEKQLNPKFYVSGGYLKIFGYKEAWNNAFKNASLRDIDLLKSLPNFDADVFFDITGIKIE